MFSDDESDDGSAPVTRSDPSTISPVTFLSANTKITYH